MFTLRILENNGKETNFVLGNNYSLYLKGFHDEEIENIFEYETENVAKEFHFENNLNLPAQKLYEAGLYGLVVGETQTILLWQKPQRHYIMLAGQTHDNVSYEAVGIGEI